MIKFNIITMFPDMFKILDFGISGKHNNNKYQLNIIDLKQYSQNYRVDNITYGSSGMLLCPEPIEKAIIDHNLNNIIYTSPRGDIWNNTMAQQYSKQKEITILCGRYEGVDQRVLDLYSMKEISIGDFVLSGGEIAAVAMIDSIIRFAGVVKTHSLNDSFSNGLLEHDNYTRPEIWRNMKVPDILLTGNHEKIQRWKLFNSIDNTLKTRKEILFDYLIKKLQKLTG